MVKSFVKFGYADSALNIANKRSIQSFVVQLFHVELGMPCQLQYVFCSDDYLIEINRSYLNHDDYTDIITFDLSEDRDTLIAGEIYISVDRVKDNSVKLGLPFIDECLRVIFHGALHLCGYKDKTAKDKLMMRSKEDEYLSKFLNN